MRSVPQQVKSAEVGITFCATVNGTSTWATLAGVPGALVAATRTVLPSPLMMDDQLSLLALERDMKTISWLLDSQVTTNDVTGFDSNFV